jgi:hypothetical protein
MRSEKVAGKREQETAIRRCSGDFSNVAISALQLLAPHIMYECAHFLDAEKTGRAHEQQLGIVLVRQRGGRNA